MPCQGALVLRAPCWGAFVSYTVHIQQSATGLVRMRVEAEEWLADGPLWTKGNRACDCARALLFAKDGEKVECGCGAHAYAIRVTAPDGAELYREEDFRGSPATWNRVPATERDVPVKAVRELSPLMALVKSE